jgi:Spy/CpxP family protein refolding chaperone
MNRLRTMLSVVCVTAALGSATDVWAATQAVTPNAAPMRQGWHDGRGGPGGGMHRILDQLDLSAEQTSQVQSIFAQTRPQLQAVRESGRANREQLEVTPPTDPGYAGLVASAKSNAAEQIQLMSDLWVKVYAILTPDQRARIPGIVAAQRADRDSNRPTGPLPPG